MAGIVGRGADQYMVRLPAGMRDELKAAADRNSRSINSEIVARIGNQIEGPIEGRCDECAFSRRNSYTNCFRFPRSTTEDFLVVAEDGWCGEFRPKAGA